MKYNYKNLIDTENIATKNNDKDNFHIYIYIYIYPNI